jgi:hypothetical protein
MIEPEYVYIVEIYRQWASNKDEKPPMMLYKTGLYASLENARKAAAFYKRHFRGSYIVETKMRCAKVGEFEVVE